MEAIIKGNLNYIKKTEIKQNRLDACNGCKYNKKASIKALSLSDENEIISNRICGKCWCPLPSLLRQDIKICELWKE